MTDRAVSSTVGYVMALAIATVLVTGLLISGASFVDDQRERVIEQELDVVGQHLSGNIEQVDRMVRASDESDPTARINQTFNRQVTGASYSIELVAGSPTVLHLNASDSDVSTTVNVTNQTDVSDSFASGGEVTVRYNATSTMIEVTNA